ncbi:MAG: nuclear transport factor 2 family protein [Chloracidobacterium sp.]|nr:nuclear transport factor 2 family protein [Chloracidobacterium sp.]
MGNIIIVAALLAVATFAQRPDGQRNASKDSKSLSQLEGVWNEAHVKGDAHTLDELWGDDLVVTVPGMPSMTKTQSLAIWKSGKFKFERYQTSDVRIKVYGDAAVVTGHMRRSRTMGDRKAEDDWLFTKFYMRAKGRWKVVAFHASTAPQENK